MEDKMPRSEIGTLGKVAIGSYGAVASISAGGMAPIMPQIATEFFGPNEALRVSMALTAWGLGMLIGSPIGGRIADRYGRRNTMLISATLTAVAGCGVPFTQSLEAVIVARFLVGLTLGTFTSAIIAAIGDAWEGRQRDYWLGAMTAIGTLSSLVSYPLIGYIARDGWRMTFIVYALALPMALFAWLGIHDAQAPVRRNAGGKGLDSAAVKVVVLGLLAGLVSTGAVLYSSFRLKETGLHTALEIALYALPSVFGTATTSFCYSTIRRFVSVDDLFILSPTLCAAGVGLMAVASEPWQASLGLFIMGFGIGSFLPNLAAHAIRISAPENRALIIGLMKGAVYGGPFAGQFALTPLYQAGGSSLALLGLAGTSAALAVVMAGRRLGRRGSVDPIPAATGAPPPR